jgi:serine/threonine protein kinase
VARGLRYLHVDATPPIIHQDVKSDNILLNMIDGVLVAKLADFGTARYAPKLLVTDISKIGTKNVIGTTPYMPMEYLQSGHVSEKTDTYAFGVVLCELLTGEGPVSADREMLQSKMYVALANAKRNLPPLLDARLGGSDGWPLKRAIALGRIARRCIEMLPDTRCVVADVLVELDGLAGRKAVRRAVRGEEYDPMTGKLLKKPQVLVAAAHGATRAAGAPSTNTS